MPELDLDCVVDLCLGFLIKEDHNLVKYNDKFDPKVNSFCIKSENSWLRQPRPGRVKG
jgi:hypothetical protein